MSQEQNGQNKMKRYQIIIIVVAALIILGVAIFFIIRGTQQEEAIATLQTIETENTGDEVTDAVPATTFQLGLEDVIAKVNGQPVTGEEVLASYQNVINYYGEPDAENLELYYAVAMEEAVTLKLITLTAAEMGLDQYTQEELDALNVTSDSEWQYALDNYVAYNLVETDETTDEERAAAYADAESYYGLMGYTKETLRESYLENETFERVKAELCKDVTVTDDEVLAYYNDITQSDKEVYEFDIDAYENQQLMYQYGYADQQPWYRPEGYRYIQHILLAVDEELLANYTELLARYEEQMSDVEAEESADEVADEDADNDAMDNLVVADDAVDTTQEATAVIPVTAEDIDAAKAAILASVQTVVDEINTKLVQGVSFEDLIAEYGTDPGMTDGTYPNGYEVSLASYGFVTEFISAAFSVDEIGETSEPYLSDYGVHIIKYVGDVPAGPVELTDDLKTLIKENLNTEKCDAVLNDWYASAEVEYTGIVRSVEQIQAAETETETDEAE